MSFCFTAFSFFSLKTNFLLPKVVSLCIFFSLTYGKMFIRWNKSSNQMKQSQVSSGALIKSFRSFWYPADNSLEWSLVKLAQVEVSRRKFR